MANVITRTELENLKRDADDIGLIANANDTTVVTTRLGRQVKSAAKAIKDLESTAIADLTEYVDKAQAWAEKPKNDPVETGKYSALHWAAKSEEQAGLAAESATAASTAKDGAEAYREAAETYAQLAAIAGNYIGTYPTTPAANKGEIVDYTINGFKHYFQSLIDNNTNTPALVSNYWFCLTNSEAILDQIIKPYSNPLESYASTDPIEALYGGLLYGNLTGTGKWYGGVLAPNGKIYGIPYNATQILCIPYGDHGNQWWALSAYTNKF